MALILNTAVVTSEYALPSLSLAGQSGERVEGPRAVNLSSPATTVWTGRVELGDNAGVSGVRTTGGAPCCFEGDAVSLPRSISPMCMPGFSIQRYETSVSGKMAMSI